MILTQLATSHLPLSSVPVNAAEEFQEGQKTHEWNILVFRCETTLRHLVWARARPSPSLYRQSGVWAQSTGHRVHTDAHVMRCRELRFVPDHIPAMGEWGAPSRSEPGTCQRKHICSVTIKAQHHMGAVTPAAGAVWVLSHRSTADMFFCFFYHVTQTAYYSPTAPCGHLLKMTIQ